MFPIVVESCLNINNIWSFVDKIIGWIPFAPILKVRTPNLFHLSTTLCFMNSCPASTKKKKILFLGIRLQVQVRNKDY
jgi:hypothetical protein